MKHSRNTEKTGFTLIELLTVMAIGIILMSISTAAYFGMVRSSALGGAVSSVRTVVSLARQHAISNRRRTYIVFDKEASAGGIEGKARMCVCEHVATHVGGGGTTFEAEVTIGQEDDYAGCRIFNIDRGVYGKAIGSQERYIDTGGADSITWSQGDRCALLIHDWVDLPEGLVFTNIPGTVLYFRQDGTTPELGGSDFDIHIVEQDGDGDVMVRVEAISGDINVVRGVVN
mgnify:CR=1 FL=1